MSQRVPMAPEFEAVRQATIAFNERLLRAHREREMHWARGLSLWLDRWTPYYVNPEAMVERGDQALADLLITVAKMPASIQA